MAKQRVKYKRPKYLHVFTDRHGKNERIYFNRPGQRKIAIRGPENSPAFWEDYLAASNDMPKVATGAGVSKTVSGTINALIVQYYESAGFISKAEATKRNYKSIIEPFRKDHGDKRVSTLQTHNIDKILGEVAAKSTAQAKNLRKRLSMLMQLAIKWKYRTDNPILNADRVQHKSKGYQPWTEDDIEVFRNHWGDETPQRVAVEILLYTGLRRSDAVKIGRQHIQGDFIVMTTQKSGHTVELNIPIHADFRKVLDGIAKKHLNFIVTAYGAARSEKAFTNWIIEAARKAGLPPHRSPHGLRKSAMTMLAEAGCSAMEIMAITGHQDIKEIETYIAKANQKKMAQNAIKKLKAIA
ncbi:tyrosine-type recombinase/integrase [Pararhizobium qamdonense]|uniref:tyrosine-type recombinase/integrase n=1 Tax=Pararhizobium qamdonense TaxID=3031126 RepID=UPI0023E300DC|nr:tyrosine-type recombinase/integrase [Pararhizobium qamdonense]